MRRIDLALFELGYCESRSVAAKLIKGGFVFVDGKKVEKPSLEVEEGVEIEIVENPLTRFVSRGGLKLEAALKEFSVDPTGLICCDLGASTGGFTDCLLQNGAKKVYAIDSGRDQLHASLRKNVCVVSMEGVNARFLDESMIEKVDLCVMDVSFISQRLLYHTVRHILKSNGIFISLIKPQFEVGKENIGKGGIVKDTVAAEKAVEELKAEAEKNGLRMIRTTPSPILGGDGNAEILALFEKI